MRKHLVRWSYQPTTTWRVALTKLKPFTRGYHQATAAIVTGAARIVRKHLVRRTRCAINCLVPHGSTCLQQVEPGGEEGGARKAKRLVGLQPTVIASRAPHLLLEQSVMTVGRKRKRYVQKVNVFSIGREKTRT